MEIVLGVGLNNPVKSLVCWTQGEQEVGGTAQGIRVAQAHGIPVKNLALKSDMDFANKKLGKAVCLCNRSIG